MQSGADDELLEKSAIKAQQFFLINDRGLKISPSFLCCFFWIPYLTQTITKHFCVGLVFVTPT